MHGGPGYGLHEDDQPGHMGTGPLTAESIVGLHSPLDKSLLPLADAVLSRFKIRSLGSATLHLAYVANGLLDGAVDFNVKIWDLAAAIALCRAVGAEVNFLNGPQLPLRQFDLKMKRIVYMAGRPELCEVLTGLFAGKLPV